MKELLIHKLLHPLFKISYNKLSEPLILSFHGVINRRYENLLVQNNQIQFEEFEKIICFLRKYYIFLDLDEFRFLLSEKRKLPKNSVVLTFDDGYRNNLTLVEPFLSRYGIPFSIFINTRYITERLRIPTYYLKTALLYTTKKTISLSCYPKRIEISDVNSRYFILRKLLQVIKTLNTRAIERTTTELKELLPLERWEELNLKFISEALLKWEEVKILSNKGVKIGSHGHDHCSLGCYEDEEVIRYQVELSKTIIESNIAKKCYYFCYPNGRVSDISRNAVNAIKKAEYALAFTTIHGSFINSLSPFLLPRFSVHYKRVHLLPFICRANSFSSRKHQSVILLERNKLAKISTQKKIYISSLDKYFNFCYWILAFIRNIFLKEYSARNYSNLFLKKYLKYLGGDIINVSGWQDYDREKDYYRSYFGNVNTYTVSNIYGDRGFPDVRKNRINWIYLDLEKELDASLIKKFDVVFCHTVFEHVFKLETAMENIAKMSKDIIIIIVPFSQSVHYTRSYSDYSRFTAYYLEKYFKSKGFHTLAIDSNDSPYVDIYITYIASLHPEKYNVFYNATCHYDIRLRPFKFGVIKKTTGQGLDNE